VEKAEEVSRIIQGIEGIGDIKVEQITGLPQVVVKFNRDKIALYGLNIQDLSNTLKTAFAGAVAGVVYEGDRRFDLVVRLDSSYRKDIENVRSIFITLPSGEQIPIQQIADIEYEEGPQQIARDDGKRRITVGINVRNRDVQSLVNEIKGKLDKQLKLPPNYYVTYGGQFQNLIEANKRLSTAVPIALILILLILFFTFKSVKETLLIFTAIPFSAVGGVAALYLRGMPFSISAGVGFIALFGVAVLNGIVLISYINSLEKEGVVDIHERVLKGTRNRLRPVLMTAFVASFGFLPMAISTSAGAEVQKPLATVVIGGLITSTILTLIVLPVLYSIFSKKFKFNFRKGKKGLTISILILFLSLPSISLFSQQTKSEISLDKAVELGLMNNLTVKSSMDEIRVQDKLKGTAFDIGKTEFSYNYGQINSPIINDNEIVVSQRLAFPTVYLSQANFYEQNRLGSTLKSDIVKNNLIREIKSIYYKLLVINRKLNLILHQDSIYTDYLQKVDLKFKKGESTSLERANAESEFYDIKNKSKIIENEITILEKKLNFLLGANQNYTIQKGFNFIKKINSLDTNLISNFPELKFAEQNIIINRALTSIERNKLLPEFSIGAINKSLTGIYDVNGSSKQFTMKDRFFSFQLAIDLPIWFSPQIKRIEASEINEEISQNNYLQFKKNVLTELTANIETYNLYLKQLELYQSFRLPQAELIEINTQKSYNSGDIGYIEYLQNLKRSYDIREDYFTTIDGLNQTIINIEYLTGTK
ncbi:MAG: efflux RND transporter permease subunit, partial [Bacteroidetes bacterium]|nr:efflux RND transporter permease subunit [Bacteroidota bacterium]